MFAKFADTYYVLDLAYLYIALVGRPHGMLAEDANLSDHHAAGHHDHLLEADDEGIQELVRGAPQAPSALGAADKAEVLNHLANFGSLQDSDFLPPGNHLKSSYEHRKLLSSSLIYVVL